MKRMGAVVGVVALALAGACGGNSLTGGTGGSGTPSGNGGGGDTGAGGSGTGGAGSASAQGTGGDLGTGGKVGGHPPWVELAQPVLDVQGGSALSAGGVGQNGGLVHLIANGNVAFDASQPAVPAQSVPATSGGAKALDDATLAADVSVSGDASIATVASGGADMTRKIAVSGDLYVTGTLRAADLTGARQSLALQAGGTIYVSGTIDASGAAGAGQAGGAVSLTAKQVIVTGTVRTSGGDGGTSGGAAGALTIQTSQGVFVTGTIDTSGGNVNAAGSLVAGAGAQVKIQAGGDVGIAGKVLVRGGGAASSDTGSAQGGDAGFLVVDSNGAITLGGTIDGRGGLAKAAAAGGTVAGGKAAEIHVGEYAQPKSIAILVPLVATGGDGAATAGTGGTLTPAPGTGDFIVAGAHEIDLSGGNSSATPGAGGLLNGGPRTDPGSGGVHITGDITVNGGSITAGGTGNGADGGRVDMELIPTSGAVSIDQSANIVVNGGASGGSGTAGGGGHVWFFTKDGDVTCAGHVTTDGGDAPDPGGVGGKGGMIYFFTDNNHNAVEVPLGNLLITTTGVLESNGGNGATGGSARNDGMAGLVPVFPDNQEAIAIFLNCDGEHGNTNNWMENDGWLYAKGGAHNGNGGDIVYHGIPKDARMDPNFDTYPDYPVPSGNIQTSGDGNGAKGDFLGE